MKGFENPVIDFLYRFIVCVLGICAILISYASVYVAPLWVGFTYHWSLGALTFLFFICLQIYLEDFLEKLKPQENEDE